MINKATTTFISHLTSFFHFSHSHAAITLNHVITIIIIAKKNAKAFNAESTTKNTLCAASSNHSIHLPVVKVSQILKFNTSPNIRFAQYTNNHHIKIYIRLHKVFFTSSGFLLNNIEAPARTKYIIIIHNVISLTT